MRGAAVNYIAAFVLRLIAEAALVTARNDKRANPHMLCLMFMCRDSADAYEVQP